MVLLCSACRCSVCSQRSCWGPLGRGAEMPAQPHIHSHRVCLLSSWKPAVPFHASATWQVPHGLWVSCLSATTQLKISWAIALSSVHPDSMAPEYGSVGAATTLPIQPLKLSVLGFKYQFFCLLAVKTQETSLSEPQFPYIFNECYKL